MAYIGNSPANVGNFQVVDDISSTFNGVLVTFALTALTLPISPAKSGQLLVSINGVLQEPDDTGTEGFKVSGSNIVFSSAPATGSTFWAVWQGQAVDIGTPSDNTVGNAQVADDALSGNKIDGGTISNFTSTGIDDNATSTKITVSDSNVGLSTQLNIERNAVNAKSYQRDISGIVGGMNLTESSFINTGGGGGYTNGAYGFVKTDETSRASAYVVYVADNDNYSASTDERMRIDSAGNVGIGTAPQSSISVNTTLLALGNRVSIYEYDDSSNPAQLNINQNDRGDEKYKVTGFASRYQHRNGVHNFQTAPSGSADAAITYTTAMTINSDGHMYTTSGKHSGWGGKTGQNHTQIGMYHNGAGELWLTRGGADTIARFGYQPTNTAVGSISISSTNTAYNTSSDYRLKENVVPMTGSIDRLKALKPSNFNFISEPLKVVDGFLAHEAGEVVPECASGTKDAMMDEEYEVTPAVMDGETVVTEAVMGTRSVPDYQGIDQSKLVPLLVASLQEAVAKIEALEARVTALEV